MSGLPSFGWGGVGTVATPEEFTNSLFDQSLPFLDTFSAGAATGFLTGPAGTKIRDLQLPDAAPVTEGEVVDRPNVEKPVVVETPNYLSDRLGGAPDTLGGYVGARSETPQELATRRDEAGAIDEATYKASAYYRPDIPWSRAMTIDRAKVQSEFRDAQKARDFFMEKRPIVAFLGGIAGSIPDPTNYIPVAGPAVRAAAIARAGRTLGTAAVMAGEAAVSQGVLGLANAGVREQFGDDVSWQAQVTDIAMGAVTGGLIGGLVGRVASHFEVKADSLQQQMKARAALDDAVRGLAVEGEVKLTPTSAGFLDEAAGNVAQARLRSEIENADPFLARAEGVVSSRKPQSDTSIQLPEGVTLRPEGPFGPAADGFSGRWEEAADWLRQNGGEATRALDHPEVGPIDVPWGKYDAASGNGYGLSKIEAKHPDVVAQLPDIINRMSVESMTPNRAILTSADHRAVVRLDYDGQAKTWLLTAYAKEDRNRHVRGTTERPDGLQADTSSTLPAAKDIASPAPQIDPARIQQANRAAASIAKSETLSGFAKDVGFDPVTGENAASNLVRQIEAEGRLTPEAVAEIKAAQDGIADADAFAKALEVATGCVL